MPFKAGAMLFKAGAMLFKAGAMPFKASAMPFGTAAYLGVCAAEKHRTATLLAEALPTYTAGRAG